MNERDTPSPDTGAGTPLTEQQEFDQQMAFTCDCTSWREHQDRVFDALDAARSRPATDPAGLDAAITATEDTPEGTPLDDPQREWYEAGWDDRGHAIRDRLSVAATDPSGLDFAERWIASLHEYNGAVWTTKAELRWLARLSVADGPGPEERPHDHNVDTCHDCRRLGR